MSQAIDVMKKYIIGEGSYHLQPEPEPQPEPQPEPELDFSNLMAKTPVLRKDTSEKELKEFVDGLSADQMKKLSAFYNSMPRLEHKVKVKNPKTEVESEVTLKGLASFFG